MGYNFVGVDRDQPFLLPPSLTDWLPPDHLAWFVLDAVAELDLSEFVKAYRADGRGGAAHDPSMMAGMLLYAYCTGVVSSRKIEAACQVDVAFRVIAGNLVPDHTTIARFRATHADALAGLFTQVLAMCAEAGLVKVGTIAVDGTKISVSASLDANRTREAIMKQVEELIAAAEAADAGEDEVFGAGVRGDEVPADLRDRTSRRARLAAAKARLDAVDAARQAEYDTHLAERAAKEQAAGKKLRGRKPKPPAEKAPKTNPPKVNTTDPESRMMPIRNGWVQGYNAQAVATESQIIIACDVTQDTGDTAQLTPMIAAANRELDAAGVTEPIGVVLGDAGYCTEAVLAGLPDDGPDYYLAARNMRHGKPRVGSRGRLPAGATLMDKMDRKVSRKAGRVHYDKRKWIIEPVFGQIKTGRGIRSFTRRGFHAAAAEWKLIAATHNLRKLHRHLLATAAAPITAI